MAIARFMASPAGRIARAVLGIALIVWGISLQSALGWTIAIIGLVPLAAGVFDVCPISPILGLPFLGRDVRAR